MKKRFVSVILVLICAASILVVPKKTTAQNRYPSLLSMKILKSMANEVSGTLPHNIMKEIAAFNRNRTAEEYQGTYWESEVMVKYAKQFGFTDVKIETFPLALPGMPAKQWDAELGELWMVSPDEKLIISHRDIPPSLAEGSKTADTTARLVYAGSGDKDSDYADLDVKGKIVLVSGAGKNWGSSTVSAYNLAVQKYGAVGIVNFRQARQYDRPDQVRFAGITGFFRPGQVKEGTFAFNLPYRLGDELRRKLEAGEKITLRAKVKTAEYETDNEVPTAVIPGTGEIDEEVCFVAHLYEGVTKQGANDDVSGCVATLEAGRMLIRLINEGKIERPKRTIRFLWVPEIISTYQFFEKYPDIVKKFIAGINMDMVGENVHKNLNLLNLVTTLHSMQSYVNDVNQHFFEFVYWGNRESPLVSRNPFPIFDVNGTRNPFYYSIEPYSSGSDHIVFQMPSYQIPCVFYFNWPDMHYHSNEDRPDKADRTELKRVAFIGAASAYAMANGGPDDIPVFISEMAGNGDERLGKDISTCFYKLQNAGKEKIHDVYKEMKSKIYWDFKREERNILSLHDFTENDKNAKSMVDGMARTMMEKVKAAEKQIESYYTNLCSKNGTSPVKPELTADEKAANKMIPARLNFSQGIMQLFFMRAKGIPQNMVQELLNFIDGKNSILDIRNAAAAEYSPVKVSDVVAFMEQQEKSGVIKINRK